MLCIFQASNDIYFNLAAEEYLLKNKHEDILMLWRSDPCVVIGKHQNTYAEINHRFIDENKIPVARRLTGGGTVYHDQGNLNFTFIVNGNSGKLVDFKKFVGPVTEFLKTLGIKADIGEKNDILINGLKISGNAEHVYKNRVLHHGTLLYNSNLNHLREALKVVPGRYTDKAVKSNRVSVTNISNHLTIKKSISEYEQMLFEFLMKKNPDSCIYSLTEKEVTEILQLRNEKYINWQWIYGYSPSFIVNVTLNFENKANFIEIVVEKGIIKYIRTDDPLTGYFAGFLKLLINKPFKYQHIKNELEYSELSDEEKNRLLDQFF